jgi:cellulose synthase/poly-beta-1,6-N-acetylglucosamine synthase-like glycosyltransferase
LSGVEFQAGEFWRDAVEVVAWVVAGVWCWRVSDAVRFLPEVIDLTSLDWDRGPVDQRTLTVVVPAKDEAANLAATLDALLMADYQALRILVVDDRSTDATGTIADEYERRAIGNREKGVGRSRPRLDVVHVKELPRGWLGKTHALEVGTRSSDSEYLLFTDADVLFSPSVLRRAMAYAEASEADHLVVMPTMQIEKRGEGIVLGFMQILGMWYSRAWRVSDPEVRDFVGVGAFNLVRREALEAIGGWAPQRMAVLEDVTLGRRMKLAGMRQRIAFAPGLVLLHWARGARGLMRVMTKNLFAAFNFQPLLLLGMCAWIAVFCLAPVAGLFWWTTLAPSLLVLICMGASYRLMGSVSGIDARYAWLYPLGALAFVWAMLRSMATVLARRGVVWRGTFYSLRDLRRHNKPDTVEEAG